MADIKPHELYVVLFSGDLLRGHGSPVAILSADSVPDPFTGSWTSRLSPSVTERPEALPTNELRLLPRLNGMDRLL